MAFGGANQGIRKEGFSDEYLGNFRIINRAPGFWGHGPGPFQRGKKGFLSPKASPKSGRSFGIGPGLCQALYIVPQGIDQTQRAIPGPRGIPGAMGLPLGRWR